MAVAATALRDMSACSLETMTILAAERIKGIEAFESYVFRHSSLLAGDCRSVKARSAVVVREVARDSPFVCVEYSQGQECRWVILDNIVSDPQGSTWPITPRLWERNAVDVCRLALDPRGRGWNTGAWSAVMEADKRGLNLDMCRTLVSDPKTAPGGASAPAAPSGSRPASPSGGLGEPRKVTVETVQSPYSNATRTPRAGEGFVVNAPP